MDTLLEPWKLACTLWPELEYKNPPKFRINNRLRKTAGLCQVETGAIELSGPLLAKYPSRMMRDIVPHETAHYIDFLLNGWYPRKRHHGKPWQEIMLALGCKPEPFHDMEL